MNDLMKLIQIIISISCLIDFTIRFVMEEIGITVSKEIEEVETKSFVLSSQYEQLENDDLYTKFKVINIFFSLLCC